MSYDPKWIRDDAVVKRDGTNDLTGDWDIGNQRAIVLDELQIRDASGLTISDTTANILVSIDNQTGLLSLQHGTGINEFSTDTSFTKNSDYVVPSQKAVKAYVDNITGNNILNDNPADGEASGFKATVTVDTTAAGLALFMASDGDYYLSSADSTSGPCIAISLDSQTVLKYGYTRNNSWSFSNLGQPVYLSTTPGDLTQTAPSTSGDIVQIVGIATASNIILFNPNYAVAVVA